MLPWQTAYFISNRNPLFLRSQLRKFSLKMTINNIPAKDRESFTEHLQKSKRILALCGAGLSASSGLPTFRGAGGLWRNYDATSLATPEAFEEQPDLVWQFYSHRRHMALNVNPNPAHYALAELARKRPEFVTLTQNVDGKNEPSLVALENLANVDVQDSVPGPIIPQNNCTCYTVHSLMSVAPRSTVITWRRTTSPIQSCQHSLCQSRPQNHALRLQTTPVQKHASHHQMIPAETMLPDRKTLTFLTLRFLWQTYPRKIFLSARNARKVCSDLVWSGLAKLCRSIP